VGYKTGAAAVWNAVTDNLVLEGEPRNNIKERWECLNPFEDKDAQLKSQNLVSDFKLLAENVGKHESLLELLVNGEISMYLAGLCCFWKREIMSKTFGWERAGSVPALAIYL
jgi:hypothetical protein